MLYAYGSWYRRFWNIFQSEGPIGWDLKIGRSLIGLGFIEFFLITFCKIFFGGSCFYPPSPIIPSCVPTSKFLGVTKSIKYLICPTLFVKQFWGILQNWRFINSLLPESMNETFNIVLFSDDFESLLWRNLTEMKFLLLLQSFLRNRKCQKPKKKFCFVCLKNEIIMKINSN